MVVTRLAKDRIRKKDESSIIQSIIRGLQEDGLFPVLTPEQLKEQAERDKIMLGYQPGMIITDAAGNNAIYIKMVSRGGKDTGTKYIYGRHGSGPGGYLTDIDGAILFDIMDYHPHEDPERDTEYYKFITKLPDPNDRVVTFVENPVFMGVSPSMRDAFAIHREHSGETKNLSHKEFLEYMADFNEKKAKEEKLLAAEESRKSTELTAEVASQLVAKINEKLNAKEQWTTEHVMFIKANFKRLSYDKLTDEINAHFGLEKSKKQVQYFCKGLGLSKTPGKDEDEE